MKRIVDFKLIAKEMVTPELALLELKSKGALPEMRAGQFVNVAVKGDGLLLRRPISIFDAKESEGILSLLIKRVGMGTAWLTNLSLGEVVNITLPLGNGFPLPKKFPRKSSTPSTMQSQIESLAKYVQMSGKYGAKSTILLVGGGVGVAPLHFLAKKLNEAKFHPTLLIGTKTASEIPLKERFERLCDTYYTTEDGSFGERGFPTDHSLLKRSFDLIYCCGPTPMMRAVAKYAASKKIPCYVSLENRMACGIGACLCCVQTTKRGQKSVCTDGPIFSINELKW